MQLVGVVAAVCVLMFGTPGCKDPHAEDKAAIRQMMRDYHQANQDRSGSTVVSMMSPETLAHYDQILRLALDGTAAQVRARSAFDKMEIVMLRALSSRKELKGLDGLGYQIMATNKGWYADEENQYDTWTDGMADLSVDTTGDGAWCYILENHKRTAHTLKFEKKNGRWLFDERSIHPYVEWWIKEEAKLSGLPEDEIIIQSVEDFHEIEIDRKTIWQPMKK